MMGKAFKVPISIWIFIIGGCVTVSGVIVPIRVDLRIGLVTFGLLLGFINIIMLQISVIKKKLSDIDEDIKEERKIEVVQRPVDKPAIQRRLQGEIVRIYNPLFKVAGDRSVFTEGILPAIRNTKRGKMIVSPEKIEDLEKFIKDMKNKFKLRKRKIRTLLEKFEFHRMIDSLGGPSYTVFIPTMNARSRCLLYIPEEPFMSGDTPHWGFFIYDDSLVTEIISKFDDIWDNKNKSIPMDLGNLMKKLGIT